MTVLQVCAYAAPHEGNFMKSLYTLDDLLMQQGTQTIYAFPETAYALEWCKELEKRRKVYYLPLAKARVLPKTYFLIKRIYDENPDISIVHSHFELYDIPVTITARRNINVFWHLHDAVQVNDGIRTLLWKLQYGVVGKKAYLLSVAEKYRDEIVKLGFPANKTQTVLNGIDLKRVKKDCAVGKHKKYDFLTFGWDFYRKGDDLILDACKLLHKQGYRFKLLLNGSENTFLELKQYLGGDEPDYIDLGYPVSDVNKLFEDSRVFIQASRRETFSYAICEASYAGLPAICSDIPGLEWAHELGNVSFFESGNSEQLAELMAKAIRQSGESPDVFSTTCKIIEEKYSVDAWAQKIAKVYGLTK